MNDVTSSIFLIVWENMECLSFSGLLDLMKHSSTVVVGTVRGPGENHWEVYGRNMELEAMEDMISRCRKWNPPLGLIAARFHRCISAETRVPTSAPSL